MLNISKYAQTDSIFASPRLWLQKFRIILNCNLIKHTVIDLIIILNNSRDRPKAKRKWKFILGLERFTDAWCKNTPILLNGCYWQHIICNWAKARSQIPCLITVFRRFLWVSFRCIISWTGWLVCMKSCLILVRQYCDPFQFAGSCVNQVYSLHIIILVKLHPSCKLSLFFSPH